MSKFKAAPSQVTLYICMIKEACTALGAKSKLYHGEDASGKVPLKSLNQVNLDNLDHLTTHNKWGEYGHLHHKQVHHWSDACED